MQSVLNNVLCKYSPRNKEIFKEVVLVVILGIDRLFVSWELAHITHNSLNGSYSHSAYLADLF